MFMFSFKPEHRAPFKGCVKFKKMYIEFVPFTKHFTQLLSRKMPKMVRDPKLFKIYFLSALFWLVLFVMCSFLL